MKKVFSLFLAVIMLLSVTAGFGTTAFAAGTTNNQMVALLPKSLKAGEPTLPNVKMGYINGKATAGYQVYVCHEKDTSNPVYQDMLRQTKEIIKGKQSTYDKAVAIMQWVNSNMTYQYFSPAMNNINSVYYIYTYRKGNCMCYAQLSNYMYYLAGIPSAMVENVGHEYSCVLIDGKWYKLDATNNLVTDNFDDGNQIEVICFTLPSGLTMVVDDLSGVKLTGTRFSLNDDPPKSITVPSYVTSSYIHWFYTCDGFIHGTGEFGIKKVNGTKGSRFEKWIKKYYKCITYNGKRFTAMPNHHYKAKNVIRDKSKKSEILHTCTRCGSHYSVNASGWIKHKGKWLYFKNGYRQTGFLKMGSSEWYYLNGKGEMQIGWQKIGGKWYYFHSNGKMEQVAVTINGKNYWFNSDGTMIIGWYQLPFTDYWYYHLPDGAQAANCWQKIGGKWYYFDNTGRMVTGWRKIAGDWYYFNSSGEMRTADLRQNGKTYRFASSGVCLNP